MNVAEGLNSASEWDLILQELAEKDDKLGTWIKSQSEIEDFAFEESEEPYLAIVASIVSQQLSTKAADTIYGRLEALFPDGTIHFSGLNEIDDETLRSIGLSARKVKSVKDLCSHILDGRLPEVEKLKNLPDEEIIKRLCGVYGVGQWTAENFLIGQLGRMDVLPAGDLILRRGFSRIFYKRDDPAGIDEVRAYAKRWSPYRTAAAKLLWIAGAAE